MLLTGNPPAEQVSGDFAWTPFLVVIVIVASYQVSQAPYVSDYSRYLPRSSTVRSTFLWSYFGSAAGSFWMIALGAFLLASYPDTESIGAVAAGGDAIFDGFGTIVLATALIGLVSVISLNLYSGSLAMLAAVDTVVPIRASVTTRAVAIGVILVLGTAGSLLLPADFLGSYNVFLVILLYSLVPWTAINLVDFFFVRRGDYAILEIFKPNGIYGAWNWRGLVAYVIGIAVMVPVLRDLQRRPGDLRRPDRASRSTSRTCRCSSVCPFRRSCTGCSAGTLTSAGNGSWPWKRRRSSRRCRRRRPPGGGRPPRHEAADDLLDCWPVRAHRPTWRRRLHRRRGGGPAGHLGEGRRRRGRHAVVAEPLPGHRRAGADGGRRRRRGGDGIGPGGRSRVAPSGSWAWSTAAATSATFSGDECEPWYGGITGRTSRPRATC